MRRKLFDEGSSRCAFCAVELDPATASLDHIIPISAGGTTSIDNLRLVCGTCNASVADRVVAIASSPATEAAKLWIRAFNRNSTRTLILTAVGLLAGLAPTVWKMMEGTKGSPEQPFAEQIRQLDATERSLRDLTIFIQNQRNQLSQDRETLAKLQNEKKSLEPVVAAQRETVEAILRAQEARAAKDAGRERWIGFGLGVLASLIASAVAAVLRFFYFRRKLKGSGATHVDGT